MRLVLLDISHNSISSSLPASLGIPTNLRYLYLNNNKMRGPVPSELCALVQLQELSLASNYFSGELPHEIGLLNSIRTFDISGNAITGSIPRVPWPHATSFSASSNSLSGHVPRSFASMRNLTSLNLDHNLLSGPLNFIDPTLQVSTIDNLTLSKIRPPPHQIQHQHKSRTHRLYPSLITRSAVSSYSTCPPISFRMLFPLAYFCCRACRFLLPRQTASAAASCPSQRCARPRDLRLSSSTAFPAAAARRYGGPIISQASQGPSLPTTSTALSPHV